jgi:uncharacterized protein YigA (DUF484 family)
MVQAILALHLAMSMEELYAALGEHLKLNFNISRFSCFLFNNDNHCYSLDYSTVIEPVFWDEMVFREDEAPFSELYDQEPLLFPIPLEWFGNNYDLFWGHRLKHENETAAAIIFHEYPENLNNNSLMLLFLFRHFTSALVRTVIYCEMRQAKEEHAARLDLINDMGNMLGSRSLEPMLAALMNIALKILHAEVGSILLYDQNRQLTTRIEWGLDDSSIKSLQFQDQGNPSFIEKISCSKEVYIDLDITHNKKLACNDQQHQFNSIIAFPLYTPHQHYGLLNIVNIDQNSTVGDQEIETLNTIARLAATSIENHQLHEELAARKNTAAETD